MAESVLHFLGWAVRKIGAGLVISWSLMLCLGLVLLTGLSQVVEHLDVGGLLLLGLLALLCGWLLARSRLGGSSTGVAVALLGAGIVVLGAAQTLSRVAILVRETAIFISAWLSWLRGGTFPAVVGMAQAWADTVTGLAVVLGRLAGWLSNLLNRKPGYDPVATFLVWNFAIWLVLAWTAWSLRKGQTPFQAVLPAFALLASSLGLAHGPTWSLVVMLGVLFVMLAWMHYRDALQSWRQERIDFVEDIPFSLSIVTFGLVAILLVAASAAPALRIDRIKDSITRIFEEPKPASGPGRSAVVPGSSARAPQPTKSSLGESFGLEVAKPALPADYFRQAPVGGLPRQHLLGSGPELKEKQVFSIKIEPVSATAGMDELPPGRHYYWRALTYDEYTGRGWLSSPVQELHYLAGHPALSSALPGQVLVAQQVQSVGPALGLTGLYVEAGEPVSSDHNFVLAWRTQAQAAGEAGDLFGASAAVSAGESPAGSYQLTALVSLASAEQLRQAGTNYPDWVRQRFLSLPEKLPTRLYQLSRDLTAPEATPYDQALAIERYLRGFPYSLDTGVPPVDRDVVDYFLFDLKRGYCDYYASAMVVLARAAGIPARLAMGYASGSYDPQSQRYLVTEADAHSWPELYFPNSGWIGFEPTTNQAVIDRRGTGVPLAPAQIPIPEELPTVGLRLHLDWRALGRSGVTGLVIVLLGWLAWLGSETWRLRLLTPQACLLRIYADILHQGARLQALDGVSHTPREVAAAIARVLSEKLPGSLEERYPTRLPGDLRVITELYNRELYGPQQAGRLEQAQAVEAWGRLRFILWRARLTVPQLQVGRWR